MGSDDYTWICSLQGFLLAFADLSSAFWATAIFLVFILLTKYPTLSTFKFLVHGTVGVCVVIPFIFTLLIYAFQTQLHTGFDNSGNGGWCFISHKHPALRIWLHYAWMMACIAVNFIGFGVLYFHSKTFGTDNYGLHQQKAFKSAVAWCLPYPICFFFVFGPITFDRTLQVMGVIQPDLMTMIFVSILFSDPVVTSIL